MLSLSSANHQYAVLIVACGSALTAMGEQNSFYDSEIKSPLPLISEYAQKICPAGFNGYGASFRINCDVTSCLASLDITQTIPEGNVFLTSDFSLLFSKSVISKPSVEASEYTRTLRNGVKLNVRTRYVPLADDKAAIDTINTCFRQVAQSLKERLVKDPPIGLGEERILAEKLPINISERVQVIEFGKLEVAFQKSIDIREDGIISVEFTPTQKFSFTEPKIDPQWLKRIEDDLVKPRLAKIFAHKSIHIARISGDIQGASSYESSEYQGRMLVPGKGIHKSLLLQLEGSDADVMPLTPTRQVLTPLIASRWLWKAKFNDKLDSATLRIKITDPDFDVNSAPLYFRSVSIKLEKPWDYRISIFFSKYWQWIVVTFVLPFLLSFWRQRMSGKKKPVHVPLRRRLQK